MIDTNNLENIYKTQKQHRRVNSQLVMDNFMLADRTKIEADQKKANNIQILFLAVCSAFFYTLFFIFTGIIREKIVHIKSHSLTYYSGVTLVILSITFIVFDEIDLNDKRNFSKERLEYFFLRCIFGFLFVLSTIYSLSTVNILIFSFVMHLHNLTNNISFSIINKHRLNSNNLYSLGFNLMILSITLHFFFSDWTLVGLLWAGVAAVCNSASKVMDAQVSKDYHSYLIILFIGIIIVLLEPVRISFELKSFRISFNELILNVISGTFLFFYLYYFHKASDHENFLEIRIIQYTSLFGTFLLVWLFNLSNITVLKTMAMISLVGVSMFFDYKSSKSKISEEEIKDIN